jgi:cytochrome oxidase assembly protein ShyY1
MTPLPELSARVTPSRADVDAVAVFVVDWAEVVAVARGWVRRREAARGAARARTAGKHIIAAIVRGTTFVCVR